MINGIKKEDEEKRENKVCGLGLKRDIPDERDYIYEDRTLVMSPDIPKTFILEHNLKIRNQLRFNSCSAFAGTYAKAIIDGEDVEYSPAFLYYFSRVYEDGYADESNDRGATLRNMCKSLKNHGICLEDFMPYDDNLLMKTPSPEAIENAGFNKIKNYVRIKNGLLSIKQYIYSTRKPVIMGVDLYESVLQDDDVSKTGYFPIPNIRKETYCGAHALLAIGFIQKNGIKDKLKHFINKKKYSSEGYIVCIGSWGETYGDNGYIYIPYEYFENKFNNDCLVHDFWTIE